MTLSITTFNISIFSIRWNFGTFSIKVLLATFSINDTLHSNI
jgi:hypothetical protein